MLIYFLIVINLFNLYFTPCSSGSIVNFEDIIAVWVGGANLQYTGRGFESHLHNLVVAAPKNP